MGGNHPKLTRSQVDLKPREVDAMLRLFKAKHSSDVHKIAPETLVALWKDELTENLMRLLIHYLVPTPDSKLSFEGFTMLYIYLVLACNDEKARVLCSIIQETQNPTKDLLANCLCKYVREVLLSFIKLMNHRKPKRWGDWMKMGAHNSSKEANKLAMFLTADVTAGNGILDMAQLEDWLRSNSPFGVVSDQLYASIFNISFPSNDDLPIPMPIAPSDSKTLLDMSHVMFLAMSLPYEYESKWRLLFSLRSHGESWSTLLKHILSQGPTIIIVEDNSRAVFGGFAPKSWQAYPKFYGSESAFLFTLEPEIKRYDSSGYNENYQYLNTGQVTLPNGMGMGGQQGYWGFYLDSDFGKGSVSESCTTFLNYKPLTKMSSFTIRNLEVWGVGEPDPLSETRRGVFNTDPAAENLLEMAGKKMYSKGFRDDC